MKKAFVYIDDNEKIVKAFADTVTHKWNMDFDVFSNKTYGAIPKNNFDDFKAEILSIISGGIERIDCIFLDIDFAGVGSSTFPDNTGFLLGQAIRQCWPALPIVIASRFTETEIYKKGMIFDFDNICDSSELIKMSYAEFFGIVQMAIQKRSKILESLGDVPLSFRTKRNRYLKQCDVKIKKHPFAFVAMPFDAQIVRNDVWDIAIKGACKKIGIGAERVDMDKRSIAIIDKISTLLFQSVIVIADLTSWNANVLYEVGLAHASNKPCILISQQEKDKLEIPFDVRHLKTIIYKQDELKSLGDDLYEALKEWRAYSV